MRKKVNRIKGVRYIKTRLYMDTGEPFLQTRPFVIRETPSLNIDLFCDNVKAKHKLKLSHVDAADLLVYATWEQFQKKEPCEPLDSLSDYGKSYDDPVIVVVPRFWSEALARIGRPLSPVDLKPTFTFPNPGSWGDEQDIYTIPGPLADRLFRSESTGKTLTLYKRAAVNELFKWLSDKDQFKMITGPPGVGKSTSTLVFALNLPIEEKGRKVMWIQQDLKRVLVFDREKVDLYLFADIEPREILKLLLGSITDVFFDQYRAHKTGDTRMLDSLISWAQKEDSPLQRLVLITSDDSMKPEFVFRHKQFYMGPWTIDEYRTILKNPDIQSRFNETMTEISTRDNLDERIELKFFYAGISARFMLEMSIVDITRVVMDAVASVPKLSDLQAMNVGTGSDEAVNTLFYLHRAGSNRFQSFSSGFVAQSLATKTHPNVFTESLVKFGPFVNRGNVGFHFEAYAVASIAHRMWMPPMELLGDFPEDYALIPSDVPVPLDMLKMDQTNVPTNRWLLPIKSTNRSFDIFRVVPLSHSRSRFLFLRITVERENSCNPRHLAETVQLFNRWKETEIEIIYLIPWGNENGFNLKVTADASYLSQFDRRWSNENFFSMTRLCGIEGTGIYRRAERLDR